MSTPVDGGHHVDTNAQIREEHIQKPVPASCSVARLSNKNMHTAQTAELRVR